MSLHSYDLTLFLLYLFLLNIALYSSEKVHQLICTANDCQTKILERDSKTQQ